MVSLLVTFLRPSPGKQLFRKAVQQDRTRRHLREEPRNEIAQRQQSINMDLVRSFLGVAGDAGEDASCEDGRLPPPIFL